MTIELTRPTTALFESWAAAVAEFEGGHVDGGGYDAGMVPDRAACEAFVAKAARYADPAAELPDGHVPCDFLWITDSGEVAGFIALRRELNEHLRQFGGHIGYSVRSSRRREGIAKEALRLVLDIAREQGLDRVMLTCDDDNPGSFRTIEGAGGELQDVIDASEEGHPRLRRYWITL
ncbi:GNAT family N-acetyltransferase [Microbacterium murale]|uniref:Acetyltransferase n=1 Tax=Microbacterium murale TaxID=1081040 RepID=A0ABU0PAI6_9MICO|nr:GNAT family N-acetyltransferase [Microbacterium murale]MDQ0643962.1 putative acetyltransferase [Microbacterium murale]